jgi:hypothetical protein
MSYSRPYLSLSDESLLAQCAKHIYKASGPGGQHRNKVSSAVRFHHEPTGISGHGDDSRSQHENRRIALKRLRMNLACRLRVPLDTRNDPIDPVVLECIHQPKKPSPGGAGHRLDIGRRDHRFWHVAAVVLDLLDARRGRLSDVSALLGISTGNLVRFCKSDRHLLSACQEVRKLHDLKPIS